MIFNIGKFSTTVDAAIQLSVEGRTYFQKEL